MNIALQTNVKATSTPASVSTQVHNGLLQRKCLRCGSHNIDGERENDQKKRLNLQRRAINEAVLPDVPSIVHDVLRTPGENLDQETRAFMEPRFGHDFSRVRIHTDEKAAESARAMNAYAYTVGRDVVFGAGQYSPKTKEGQRTLAHELTHVVQQGAGAGIVQTKLDITKPNDSAEREAKVAASMIMMQKDISIATLQPVAQVARETPDAGISVGGLLDNTRIQQVECVKRLGGCPSSRPGGIPSPEEIAQYNERCRDESGYSGTDVTPTPEECASSPAVPTTFPDCSTEQVTTIKKAITEAQSKWIPKAITALSASTLDSETVAALDKNFKTHNSKDVKIILSNFEKIQTGIIDSGREYECEEYHIFCLIGGAWTYCRTRSDTTHLCKEVFDLPSYQITRTVVHETGHHVGLCEDVYVEQEAEYKKMSKDKATSNPDSYAVFAGELSGMLF